MSHKSKSDMEYCLNPTSLFQLSGCSQITVASSIEQSMQHVIPACTNKLYGWYSHAYSTYSLQLVSMIWPASPTYRVTIKFPNCGHKKSNKKDTKYLLILTPTIVPNRFGTMFTSLIQHIESLRNHLLPHCLQFSRHSLLDR
jgi:hypothetical protein